MGTSGTGTDRAINIVNAVLGGILFVSPWLFGFRAETVPTWNAWIGGGAALLIAVLAASRLQDWEEWLNLIAGLWIAASPWLLSFSGAFYAMWVHLLVGLCIAGLAAMEVWRIYRMTETHAS